MKTATASGILFLDLVGALDIDVEQDVFSRAQPIPYRLPGRSVGIVVNPGPLQESLPPVLGFKSLGRDKMIVTVGPFGGTGGTGGPGNGKMQARIFALQSAAQGGLAHAGRPGQDEQGPGLFI